MKFNLRINTDLLLLIAFSLIINLPHFDHKVMLHHETKYMYIMFHYFYNHAVWYNEIPQWLPYGDYGMSGTWYQISSFSPWTSLVALCGWLVNARDTLFMYKLSILLEQFVFIFSLYLLSGRIYACRWTRLAVCFAGAGCVIWYWQINWAFRLYYLIPLALYFYHRFLSDRNAWAFWAALLTMIMSLIGGTAYWAVIYLFLFVALNIFLLPTYWRSFSCLVKPDRKMVIASVLLLITITSYAIVISSSLDDLHHLSPGRSLQDYKTNLRCFLTYVTSVWDLIHSFVDGLQPNNEFFYDLSYYIGVLPLAGLVVAVVVGIREAWFRGIAGSLALLFLLSCSGFFSWIMYWTFPGMNNVRHISYLMEIGKLLIMLAGGYGVKIIFERLQNHEWLKEHFTIWRLLSLYFILMVIIDFIISKNVYQNNNWQSDMRMYSLLPGYIKWHILARFTGWGLFLGIIYLSKIKRFQNSKMKIVPFIPFLLVAVSAFDLWTFQDYHLKCRQMGGVVRSGTLELRPLDFLASRKIDFSIYLPTLRNSIWSTEIPGNVFRPEHANVIDSDPCSIAAGLYDVIPRGLNKLLSIRNPANNNLTGANLFATDNASLNTILACGSNKLRIVQRALFANSDDQLKYIIGSVDKLETIIPLRGAPPFVQQAEGMAQFTPEYKVRFFNANRAEFDIDVKPGQAGWLVYADSFNRYWKAYINGKEAPLYEAYMAFKAVYVNEGLNQVEFRYENTLQRYSLNVLIIMSILFAALCLSAMVWFLLWRGESKSE